MSDSCDGGSIGMMPCGGPLLNAADVQSVRRWIVCDATIGSVPFTVGDPHLRTVDGVNCDFQSAGEFVRFRNESLEIQVRQMPVATSQPLPLLPVVEARRLCASVVDAAHCRHCKREVMVMGESGFAAAYQGAHT